MIKNIVSLTAAAVLGLSLAACGENDEPLEEEVEEAGAEFEGSMEEAGDDLEGAMDEAGDDMEEMADDVEDEVDPN